MKTKQEFIYTYKDKENLQNLIAAVESGTIEAPQEITINRIRYSVVFRPSSKLNKTSKRLEILESLPLLTTDNSQIIPSLGVFRLDKREQCFFKPAKIGKRHIVKKIFKNDSGKTLGRLITEVNNEAIKTQASKTLKGKPLAESKEAFFIVMNHIEGPDLFDLCVKILFKQAINDIKILRIIQAILIAYKTQIADEGLMHGDIKPENMIIIEESDGTYRAVFVDLAYAKSAEDLKIPKYIWGGTTIFLAPEIIRTETIHPPNDMYSLGLTIAELLGNHALTSMENTIDHMPSLQNKPFMEVAKFIDTLRKSGLFQFIHPTVSKHVLTALMPMLAGLTAELPEQRWAIDKTIKELEAVLDSVVSVSAVTPAPTVVLESTVVTCPLPVIPSVAEGPPGTGTAVTQGGPSLRSG